MPLDHVDNTTFPLEENEGSFLFGCPLLNIKSLTEFNKPLGSCEWNLLNHFLYQFANFFLVVSYLAPNSIGGILYLRCSVLLGSILYCLWGILVSCYIDAVIWNGFIIMINLCHVIAYIIRPIRFSRPIHKVYEQLFKPLKVSPHQFNKILQCKWQIKDFSCESCYAIENISRVGVLGMVLCGR